MNRGHSDCERSSHPLLAASSHQQVVAEDRWRFARETPILQTRAAVVWHRCRPAHFRSQRRTKAANWAIAVWKQSRD